MRLQWSGMGETRATAAAGRITLTALLAAVLGLAGCSAAGSGQATAKPGSLAANVAVAPRSTSASGPAAASAPAGITSLSGPIVALGDSYTSGDLLPLSLSTPPGCLRSSVDYARLVAKALSDSSGLVNASCSSAGVADMTSAEHTSAGQNPPQVNSLSANDALVMLTLGGDDLGFLNVLDKCMALSWRNLFGSPCRSYYDSGGTDKLAALVAAEAPRIAAVLTEIHAKAPGARVVLVGYPDLFPQQGGCWPVVPITNGDIGYLRGIEVKLNAMLAAEAKATGTTFVDTYDPTIGHDFCASANVRDVEGLIPATLTAPFHPNARGQAAMATQVLKVLAA
jgi:lysophospholipase L1-like esterase